MTPDPVESLRQVSELLRNGLAAEAQACLQNILAAYPDCVEAFRLLAGTQQLLGDLAAAEMLLRHALALDGQWTPTLATLGELLLSTGRGAEAEPFLRRASEGSMAVPRAALVLARHYHDNGRYAEALSILTPWSQRDTGNFELAAQHVAVLSKLGRHQQALRHYRRILQTQPDNLPAINAMALILNATGRAPEASQLVSRSLTARRNSAPLLNTYARSLLAQGQTDGAEAALRECVRLEPQLADAQTALAQLVWLRTGDVRETTAALDDAVRTHSKDETLLAARAAVLQGAGDARAAYASLLPLIDQEHAQPMLLMRAALSALEFDSATALTLSDRALQLVPANSAARTVRVAAQLGVGDAQAALANCEQLLDRAPDDQYLIALQTTAWRLLGDWRYAQYCNYTELVIPYQLETPAPWTSLPNFLTDLRVSLNRFHAPRGHALLFQSLRHGTETTQDLSFSSDPAIKALFTAFHAPINEYVNHLGPGKDALRRRNNGRFRFHGSWSVRLRSAGYHASHVHPRGWISSACYIELPENMQQAVSTEGILTFGAPGILTFGAPGILTTPVLTAEHSVRPEAGMLVLFPSYLWHGTIPFSSHQTRLTVAFDVVPTS
jgi:tetratricopeptide (TPR) repeat protein